MQINRSNFLREKGFDLKGLYSSKLCHPGIGYMENKGSLVDFELKELDLFISEDKFTVLTPKVEFRNKCFTQLSKTTASKVDRWDFQWYYTGEIKQVSYYFDLLFGLKLWIWNSCCKYKLFLKQIGKWTKKFNDSSKIILFEVNVDAEQQTRKIETMELIENIFKKFRRNLR